jgi:hypothetical protein
MCPEIDSDSHPVDPGYPVKILQTGLQDERDGNAQTLCLRDSEGDNSSALLRPVQRTDPGEDIDARKISPKALVYR